MAGVCTTVDSRDLIKADMHMVPFKVVTGAKSEDDARNAARKVCSSSTACRGSVTSSLSQKLVAVISVPCFMSEQVFPIL